VNVGRWDDPGPSMIVRADDGGREAVRVRSMRGCQAATCAGNADRPGLARPLLAAVLTVGGELAIWLGGDAANHPLAGALVTPVVTLPVAVRRRYPGLVGTAVPVFAAVNFMLWHGPQRRRWSPLTSENRAWRGRREAAVLCTTPTEDKARRRFAAVSID
jgi:hypothetical protein